jgi:hypothetical protein
MRYYTYTHASPDGKVFYVGKGTGHRAFSMGKRSWIWREVFEQQNGILIQIVSRFETETEAFNHEMALIDYYKEQGCKLVNLSEGGPGPLGFIQSEKTRSLKRDKMLGFKHKDIVCPNCGKTGGETSMKRWHFDKCRGLKIYKSRATVNGKRVFLGNYATKEEANVVKERYLAELI